MRAPMNLLRPALLLAAALGLLLGFPSSKAPADEQGATPPFVRITSPRGGQTRDRVVEITGALHGVSSERLTLVMGGVPLSIAHDGKRFTTRQVLAPGWNSIRVIARAGKGTLSDELSVFARVPRKDLRITMTWDTPGTDIDLWVTGPDGEKVNYQQKQGKAGGILDVDVTDGFGPETYTQARVQPGTYRVQANYYGGPQPTRVTLTIVRGEGTPEETRITRRAILLKSKDTVTFPEFVAR